MGSVRVWARVLREPGREDEGALILADESGFDTDRRSSLRTVVNDIEICGIFT